MIGRSNAAPGSFRELLVLAGTLVGLDWHDLYHRGLVRWGSSWAECKALESGMATGPLTQWIWVWWTDGGAS